MRIFWVEILAIFLCVGGGWVSGVREEVSDARENAILGWMEAMN